MDLKILRDTPPWEWPKDAGSRLRRTLRDGQAKPSDLLLAAELAGDLVVADDDLIQALLAIVGDGGAWPDLRAQAAISLGPRARIHGYRGIRRGRRGADQREDVS